MKKRMISMLMALALVVGLLPAASITASAAGMTTSVQVGSVQLNGNTPYTPDGSSAAAEKPEGDSYAYFDAETGTLTLHNFTCKGSGGVFSYQNGTLGALIFPCDDKDLIICLEGEKNTLDISSSQQTVSAICSNKGNITIRGIDGGKVGITSASTYNNPCPVGIYCVAGDLQIIDSEISVYARGLSGKNSCDGILAPGGALSIVDSKVKVDVGTTLNACGIQGYPITVTSSDVTINVASVTGKSWGMSTKKQGMTVNGGRITVTRANNNTSGYGLPEGKTTLGTGTAGVLKYGNSAASVTTQTLSAGDSLVANYTAPHLSGTTTSLYMQLTSKHCIAKAETTYGTYTVSVGGVEIKADQPILYGETVTIETTPDLGCGLKSLTVRNADGKTFPVTTEGNTHSFTMPGYAVTVVPEFEQLDPVVSITGTDSFAYTAGEQDTSFTVNALNWKESSDAADYVAVTGASYVLCDSEGNPVQGSDGKVIGGALDFSGLAPAVSQIVDVPVDLSGLPAGSYTLKVTAADPRGGTIVGEFAVAIEPKPFAAENFTVSFDDTEPPVFNGSAHAPAVTVMDGTTVLEEGVDYKLVYSDGTNEDEAINAGTATVTVEFIGNYSGTTSESFEIAPMTLTAETITTTLTPVMDGEELTCTGGIKWGDIELKEGTDYEVTVTKDGEDATKADISITFKGNYQNAKDDSEESVPVVYEDQTIRQLVKENMFEFAVEDIVYTGSEIKPVVTAVSEDMAEGTHYTVAYESNTVAGTGKIIITGIPENGFSGIIEKEFTIAKADQAAPDSELLIATGETVKSKSDGSISGVTAQMEYRLSGGEWIACTGAKIENLAAGSYEVRYAADENHNVGAVTTVEVAESSVFLTVKYDLNGGTSDAIDDQSGFAYGDKGTEKPADPTRANYAFLGWTTKDGTAWVFGESGSPVTDNITLYAKWVQTGFDVSGKVLDASGNGVQGAAVKVMQGNLLYQEVAATESDGSYMLTNVPAGTYNLVIVKDGKTVTSLVTVESDGTVEDLSLPDVAASSKLDVKAGTPNVMVDGLDAEAVAVKGGHAGADSVEITMAVEAKASVVIDAEEKADIEQAAAAQSENLNFVDIVINKKITTDGNSTTENINKTSTLLEIIIPFDTSAKKDFKIYRFHDVADHFAQKVQVLTTTPDPVTGEYIEVGSGQIIVHAQYFSTYAIGYTDSVIYIPSYSVTGPDTENGKVTLSSKYPAGGSIVKVTVTPDEGYELDTLKVTDSKGNEIALTDNGNGTYSFKMPYGSVTVNATFREIEQETVCPKDDACPISDFTDASATAWYHNGVHYCIEKGLMKGLPGNLFDPNGNTTRAQIVTVLWRLENEPVVNYAMDFEDVAEGVWYTEAIRWAASEDIVGGYGDGTFGPNDAITREQMAAILWRYAKYKDIDVSVGEDTNILSYADAFDVSEWAIPSMQWTCGAGLINGIADGDERYLDPTGNAVRAQAATILWQFCENVK